MNLPGLLGTKEPKKPLGRFLTLREPTVHHRSVLQRQRVCFERKGHSEHTRGPRIEWLSCLLSVESLWVSGQWNSNKYPLESKIVSGRFLRANERAKDHRICDGGGGAGVGGGIDGRGSFTLMTILVTWWPVRTLLTEATGGNCSSHTLERYQQWK